MHKIIERCKICQEQIITWDEEKRVTCSVCGKEFIDTESCKQEHHICYQCEQEYMRQKIIEYCLVANEDHPLVLATKLMKLPDIPMHGPIHHLLIPSALLTAYQNTKGGLDLELALQVANSRSNQIPGGTCGHWGACGGGLGVGIFYSILKEIGPLSKGEWKDVGQLTSKVLYEISKEGGPRCCKRDGFIAITTAMKFMNQYLGTIYEIEDIECEFFSNNPQCKNISCPFFPSNKSKDF